ncbi:hypothetical protein K438DRAFT_1751086 [Mycena galopus ATCC 62051]|nr:hypothetical protein K438DRAFT_1751086 [Mycena galopus ATCC 62051]
MKYQFSFGPNKSYVCNVSGLTAWDVPSSDDGLPVEVLSIIKNRKHPKAMATPHDVALSMEQGSCLMRWTDIDGKTWKQEFNLDSNYARLVRFVRNAKPTRTTFGPGFSYFSISPSGCSWQNIPPALEDDIQNCMKIRQPTCVALGIKGAYVVIYSDGAVSFELHGEYPNAADTIRNRSTRGGLQQFRLPQACQKKA